MSVKEILNDKGNTVWSVPDTAKLREAIAVLNNQNIGVVLNIAG